MMVKLSADILSEEGPPIPLVTGIIRLQSVEPTTVLLRITTALLLIARAPNLAFGADGDATQPPAHLDTHWYNLPLPMLSTASLPPQVHGYRATPLTAAEKLREGLLQNSLGPRALANRVVVAGFHQVRNRPDEWGRDWDAFGKRFEYSMARGVLENSFTTGFEIAARADERYDRCACAGFMRRSMHAWRRIVIIRRDGGGEIVDGGRLAAAYVAPAIAFRTYPSRYYTGPEIVSSGFQYLGWRVLTNMVKEFWPELHRKFRIGPHPSER